MMNETLSRRSFLRSLTLVGASALLPLAPSAQAAPSVFVPVGKASAFALHVVVSITPTGGHPIFVERIGSGQTAKAFRALSALCTHKGCPVAWKPGAKQFQCPCHGGRFDISGRNIAGPPPSPLLSLPLKVVKGTIMVAA